MPTIGDPMGRAPPQDLAGKMGEKYLRLLFAFLVEVRQYLEDGAIVARFVALEARVSAIEDTLAAIEEDIAAIAAAIGDDGTGRTVLLTYDARTAQRLSALQLQVEELRSRLKG